MKRCCLTNIALIGIEQNFRIAEEGERFVCPQCGSTTIKHDGKFHDEAELPRAPSGGSCSAGSGC